MKYKNYRNKETLDNRIYSNRDIYDMPVGEVFKRKKEILEQNRSIGIPTVQELQNSYILISFNF